MSDTSIPVPDGEADPPQDGRLNDDEDNPSTKGSGAMPTDPPEGDADPGAG